MVEELMVQQQVENVWQHMVGVICLNLTNRKVVKPFLTDLFRICSTPEEFLESMDQDTLEAMLQPLGMNKVRAKRIRKMTEQILTWDGIDASDLHGIGKYGSDSYRIFYLNDIPTDVTDKQLKKYIAGIR